jgi:hypothetical protein
MHSKQLIHALCSLGQHFTSDHPDLAVALRQAEFQNGWFTQQELKHALHHWSILLTEENLLHWLNRYPALPVKHPKKVGIIMAGNIPLVGFHDLLCVLLSGHEALVKPSSDDSVLMKYIIRYLQEQDPSLEFRLHRVERLTGFEAVIATGSNNTNRYFEYYFREVPHILRRNRTSVAVLTGNETPAKLKLLGEDLFRYYGLGCRNVAKLFVPQHFVPDTFYEAIFDYGYVSEHNKYTNNHDYYRAIYLMNQEKFLDNNFLMLKEETQLHSPVGVLYYERYTGISDVQTRLIELQDELQCVVGETGIIEQEIPFGHTQQPSLTDYADGVDVMAFLGQV